MWEKISSAISVKVSVNALVPYSEYSEYGYSTVVITQEEDRLNYHFRNDTSPTHSSVFKFDCMETSQQGSWTMVHG